MEPSYLLSSSGSPLTLGDLLMKLTEYFEDAGQNIPRDVLSEIIFFKNALFNPASHHDLRSDFYRKEIEKAFGALEKLSRLPKISWHSVLHPCQEFDFEDVTTDFKAKILIGDYVYRTTFNGITKISKITFYPDWWQQNGIEYINKKTGVRYADREIAKIKTQHQDESKINGWLQRFTNKSIECLEELRSGPETLKNLISGT